MFQPSELIRTVVSVISKELHHFPRVGSVRVPEFPTHILQIHPCEHGATRLTAAPGIGWLEYQFYIHVFLPP